MIDQQAWARAMARIAALEADLEIERMVSAQLSRALAMAAGIKDPNWSVDGLEPENRVDDRRRIVANAFGLRPAITSSSDYRRELRREGTE